MARLTSPSDHNMGTAAMNTEKMTATEGPWTISYGGGRLADIYHAESETAQDAIQVAEYDWQKGEVTEEIEAHHLHDALVRWIEDYSGDYLRNLS
jgi:hypothetical protein